MKHVKPGPGPLVLGPRGKRRRERREPTPQKGKKPRYSDQFKRQLVHEYLEGDVPQYVVAAKYGVAQQTLATWVNRALHSKKALNRALHSKKARDLNFCGTHYAKSLPPEQWPQAERFLQWLYWTKRRAEQAGTAVDVDEWLDTVRDAGLIYRDPRDDEEIEVGCEDLVANVVAGGGD